MASVVIPQCCPVAVTGILKVLGFFVCAFDTDGWILHLFFFCRICARFDVLPNDRWDYYWLRELYTTDARGTDLCCKVGCRCTHGSCRAYSQSSKSTSFLNGNLGFLLSLLHTHTSTHPSGRIQTHSTAISQTNCLSSCSCSVMVILLGLAGTTYISISNTMVQFFHLVVTGVLCGSDEKAIINKKLRRVAMFFGARALCRWRRSLGAGSHLHRHWGLTSTSPISLTRPQPHNHKHQTDQIPSREF